MNTKILIALLAIVAAAGCTIPGIPGIVPGTSLGVGKGLEMTSFTAEPSTLYNGSTVKVMMEVENQGGSTAPATKSFAYLTGTNIKVTSTDDDYWHRLSGDSITEQCKVWIEPLKPADIVKGTPGDREIVKWSLRAPDIGKGQTAPHTFMGRVYTEYETAVNGNIWVYTEAEQEAAKAAGRALQRASFTSTSGPISLAASASPDPVIISGSDKSFTLKISITNSQTGTIYKIGKITSCPPTSLASTDLNKVDVTITGDDFSYSADCTGTKEQELVGGKPVDMICDVTVKDASTPTTFTAGSFPITIRAQYGYYTERTASVTVQGK